MGEQASETPPLRILYGRGEITFCGASPRLLAAAPSDYVIYVRPASVVVAMSSPTDSDVTAADKIEADKRKAAEDAAAANNAATANWPTGGYISVIPLLFVLILSVLLARIDVSIICVVCARLVHDQYVVNLVDAMLVIFSWIKLIEKLPIFSTMCALAPEHKINRRVLSPRPFC